MRWMYSKYREQKLIGRLCDFFWWILILGGVGSLLRWGLGEALGGSRGFPWGTLTINTLGCLAMGCVFSHSSTQLSTSISPIMMALAIGFLGAFTTFSTYAMDSIRLINEGQWLSVAFYILLSNSLGLFACWWGWKTFSKLG